MTAGKGFIGIDEGRSAHMLAVGHLAQDIAADVFGWDEDKCREMFLLGYLHDVGYEFSKTQPEHPQVGGTILKDSGYVYWREVFWHGVPSPEYVSDELMLLNLADLRVNREGEEVGISRRLDDIGTRYGLDSEQYVEAKALACETREFFAEKGAPAELLL